jgi:alkaline phosphatase
MSQRFRPLLLLLACCGFAACNGGKTTLRAEAPMAKEASTLMVDVAAIQRPQGETATWWYRSGAARAAANGAMQGRAKNVIVFLGDGMDLATVAAARIFEGQRHGQPGEEYELAWERFPHTAFARTYNTDAQTPDSAGTMTAIASGVKTFQGGIGVSAGRRRACADSRDKHLLTWLELADSAGLETGIVTTARVTHATPAATYAHSPERAWENDSDLPEDALAEGCTDIARQLVEATSRGRGPRIILGGGRREFLPDTRRDPEYAEKNGHRKDGRDLIEQWREAHPDGAFVWNAGQLQAARGRSAVLGLFERSHMQYEHDRTHGAHGEPDLEQMTRFALEALSSNEHGYVLLVEGGRIDHAHHDGSAYRALDETTSFSRAVQAAVGLTSPDDTLIVVTADHAHTMTFSGYPVRGNPILDKVRGNSGEHNGSGDLAHDRRGQTYTTLNYASGPGYTGASDEQPAGPKKLPHTPSQYDAAEGRPDLSEVDTQDPDYLQEALLPMIDETHGGQDVGVWASGPGSEAIRGSLEQHVLYHVIVQATPVLRARLCAAGTCNRDGVPVDLPQPEDFEKR